MDRLAFRAVLDAYRLTREGRRHLSAEKATWERVVTAMSLVTHSIREPGEYSSGTPLMDNRSWRKNAARFRQLDALARRVLASDSKDPQ